MNIVDFIGCEKSVENLVYDFLVLDAVLDAAVQALAMTHRDGLTFAIMGQSRRLEEALTRFLGEDEAVKNALKHATEENRRLKEIIEAIPLTVEASLRTSRKPVASKETVDG